MATWLIILCAIVGAFLVLLFFYWISTPRLPGGARPAHKDDI